MKCRECGKPSDSKTDLCQTCYGQYLDEMEAEGREYDAHKQTGNVINSLKRLERAGSEQSRTTEKLREAARVLGEHVARQVPSQLWFSDLPRAYQIHTCRTFPGGEIHKKLTLWNWDEDAHLPVDIDRATALRFAADIADGWLNELAEWLEKRAAEDEAAAVSLAEKTDS